MQLVSYSTFQIFGNVITESIFKKLTKTVITVQIHIDLLVSLISWTKHLKNYYCDDYFYHLKEAISVMEKIYLPI